MCVLDLKKNFALLQRFPKLRKLSLEIEYTHINEDPKKMLLQILPHVPGLKSLNLLIAPLYEDTEDTCRLLSEVTKLSELEELSVELCIYWEMENSELFLSKLPTYCPKLRVVEISK